MSEPPTSGPAGLRAWSGKGLQLEALLFEGAPTHIYRATTADGRPVILKLLHEPTDPAAAAAGIQHEYDIAQGLDAEHVVKVLGIERDDRYLGLLLEDFGGTSLEHILRSRCLPLEEVLEIGIQVARGLADIHAAGVIHKDINPSNIVYNEQTRIAKVIDFGISSYLAREQADLGSPALLEGTLHYVSPEQTGRMNRALDYRTDFYSLGATLYELLAGRPLFDVDEPIEWLHCHIAREPLALHRVDPSIPAAVSDVVARLLAKTADERYRSASGIRADLERCLKGLREAGQVASFVLGQQDRPEHFQLPQQLYGRDLELERLMACYDRASRGSAELVLVSGYSGIGKTRLIKELYRPVTSRRGFFASGKFDQLHRNVPLSAPVSALRDLVRQLLTEDDVRLSDWRARLLATLDGNGALIVDLIPDLQTVIGPQPAVPPLPTQAAEQRFRRTLVGFIRVFCRAEHPLVMFLDDLQWADPATLNLLELLLVDSSMTHLLLIGSYRDNEVHAGHALQLALERIRGCATVDELTLPPLGPDDLNRLLADALYSDLQHVAPLTRLVEQKTGGNPYFTEEFLKDLYRRELIRYDGSSNAWAWDLDGIASEQMTDNVVELMSAKLKRLSPQAQEMLQAAACIGHRVPVGLLLAVCGNDWQRLFPALKEAMHHGLVAPVGNRVQRFSSSREPGVAERAVELVFAHDRIQQAAHEMLDLPARETTHLKIGRILITHLGTAGLDDHLFRITDHLNTARALLESEGERRELREWNRAAGKRAWSAAAHAAACEYFSNAIGLLDAACWPQDLEGTLALYADAADTACLIARYEDCDRLLDAALQHAPDHLAAARLNQIRLTSMAAQGLHTDALRLGKKLMAEFGAHYPERPTRLHVLREYLSVRRKLRGMTLEDLLALPVNTDPHTAHTFGLGEHVAAVAQVAQPGLLALMVLRGVRLALNGGVTERSISSFGGLGVQLGIYRGMIEEGEIYSQFAVELCNRFPNSASRGRVRFHHAAYLAPWIQPLRDTLEPLAHAFETCVACNDFDGAAQAATYRLGYVAACGLPLPEVEEQVRSWRASVDALGQRESVQLIDALHQWVLNLLGDAEDPALLKGSSYDIDVMLSEHGAVAPPRMILAASTRQAHLLYLFDQPQHALARMDAVTRLLPTTEPVFDGLQLHAHDALIRLAVAEERTGRERRRLLRQVARDRRVVARWAARIPASANTRLHLLDAEWHRVHGSQDLAQRQYDLAVEAAREHRLPMEEGLANACAARMHLGAGRTTIAEAYLGKARHAYQRAGAAAVVAHLEARHPALLQQAPARKRRSRTPGSHTSTTLLTGVDITALMKALKAIAGERVHSNMVRTIINTAMEFAGAQHGLLLLRDERRQLRIEAEASVDRGDAQILQSMPVAASRALSHAVVNYVTRTRESVVVHDAQEPGGPIPGLHLDQHVQQNRVCSILCLPVIASDDEEDELIGLLYLENNRASHTFTEERFDALEIIGMAVAGRLELSRKAAVDGLTGLFNRDYFQTMLRQEVGTSQRHGRTLSLILADIDHFKGFNDSWGHQAGDEVLQAVAGAVRATCRDSDVAARFGGEELAIILPDTDPAGSLALAERIRRAVEGLRVQHGVESLSVTVSLGVATLQQQMPDEHALLRAADEALYDAKHAGRNRVRAA